jgi:hypothetical protein
MANCIRTVTLHNSHIDKLDASKPKVNFSKFMRYCIDNHMEDYMMLDD